MPCHTQIDHNSVPVRSEHDVRRLDIAMDYTLEPEGLDRQGDIVHSLSDLRNAERALSYSLVECLTLDKLGLQIETLLVSKIHGSVVHEPHQ
jgi:hypothetical protein